MSCNPSYWEVDMGCEFEPGQCPKNAALEKRKNILLSLNQKVELNLNPK
jgi:hypothetical protein